MNAAPLIEITGLVKAFDLLPILRKLDLTIYRGEFVALLGANGAGKSTLLRMLAGMSKPSAGVIKVGGWELPGEAHAVRSQIGVVSHKALVYEALSARENLRFFGQLYNLPSTVLDVRIDDLLGQVGLGKRGDDLVRTYSRGMLQRLTIARALIHNPDILLLDEPYTGLDVDAAGVLDELLRNAHREGRTIVMTTHDLARVPGLVSRVVILARGVIGLDTPTTGMDSVRLSQIYTEVTSMASAR